MYLRSPITLGALPARSRRIPRAVQTSATRIRQSLGSYVYPARARGRHRGYLGDDTADPLTYTDTSVFSPADIAALTPDVGPDMTAPPPNPQLTAWNNLVAGTVLPQNPLDYTTPQAATAAGLNPNTVSAAWGTALSKYPTAQAALAAGIPAGVVTAYYTGPAASTSWFSGTTLGLPNSLLAGVGGLALLAALAGGRGRR